MYMRRLRTLMDAFMATGRLQVGRRGGGQGQAAGEAAAPGHAACTHPARSCERCTLLLLPAAHPPQSIVTDLHTKIREEAKRDAAAWKSPGRQN